MQKIHAALHAGAVRRAALPSSSSTYCTGLQNKDVIYLVYEKNKNKNKQIKKWCCWQSVTLSFTKYTAKLMQNKTV